MAIHQIVTRGGQYGRGTPSEAGNAIHALKREICDLQNNNSAGQTRTSIMSLADGRGTPSEWCVAWTKDEIDQAVHVPMNRNQTYSALMGMQRLADRFGAKAVPIDTGVAVIGCAPAIQSTRSCKGGRNPREGYINHAGYPRTSHTRTSRAMSDYLPLQLDTTWHG